jgi:hypothetical protein
MDFGTQTTFDKIAKLQGIGANYLVHMMIQ